MKAQARPSPSPGPARSNVDRLLEGLDLMIITWTWALKSPAQARKLPTLYTCNISPTQFPSVILLYATSIFGLISQSNNVNFSVR